MAFDVVGDSGSKRARDGVLLQEDRGGFVAGFVGKVVNAATQEAKCFFGEGAHRAVHSGLVLGREGFGGKGGIGGIGGKSVSAFRRYDAQGGGRVVDPWPLDA